MDTIVKWVDLFNLNRGRSTQDGCVCGGTFVPDGWGKYVDHKGRTINYCLLLCDKCHCSEAHHYDGVIL